MPGFSENKIIFDDRYYDFYDEVMYQFLVVYADEFAYGKFMDRYREAIDKLRYVGETSGRFLHIDIEEYRYLKIRGYKYILIYKYVAGEVHVLEIRYARRNLVKLLNKG